MPIAMTNAATGPKADEDWEQLLREWRPQPDARPRPFFYGRVRARLVNATAAGRPSAQAWLRWPAYAVMLGMLLLLSGDDATLQATGGARQAGSTHTEAGFSTE